MSISLIAGLGNPGSYYEETRHNIGYLVVDALAKAWGGQWKEDQKLKVLICKVSFNEKTIYLIKPQVFMNESGEAIKNVCDYYKISIDEVIVICDDINIRTGKLKVKVGGSSGGHNGINDIINYCGSDCVRFRIGIGQKEVPEMTLKDHVLGRLKEEEKIILASRFPQYIKDLENIVLNGPIKAMEVINKKTKKVIHE